jgi:translocation and assembly module TamB
MSGFRILKRLGRYSLWVFLCLLLTISAFLWYITTDSFQQMVRRRLIASVEHATGGRVELGSFHVVPLHFQVEVRNLTIHGREGPSERPLVQVDSMTAVVDLSSVLGLRMAFRSLVLVHPVVHILYYPDGSTNQPVPQEKPGSTFDQLFAISIHRLEVRRGEVFIQEQRVPVDFVSNDVEARLDYSFLHRRYSGDISVGKAETQFAGYRPLAWAAKTDFSIGAEEIQLRSFSATSERSQLQGGGTISDFRHPVFKGTYDLVLDLQQAASILRRPRATSGTFRMRGSASWSSQTYSTAGDFDLKDLLWSDPEFTAKDFSAGGKFSFDPRKIALTQVQGKFLRGTFTSEVEVSDWNGLEKPVRMSKQSTKQSPQRGTAVIKARDMSVADLLSSLGSRFRSIKGERFSGTLSGSSEIRWKDSVANAEINSSISITRPARVVAGELPLAASTHFTYRLHPAVLEISDLAANTPATQIRAVGTISNSNSLRVSVSSDNIGEWKALTSNLFPQGLPLLVAGRAAFNGSVAGIVASPAFNGNLQVYDFDTSMARPGSSPTLVHWDSLKADLQLSAASLVFRNALFRRAEASLLLDGSVGLRDWETQPSSAIHLRADAEKFSASDLASLSGQNISATGIINARIELSGTLSTPQGQGTALWKSGSLVGYSFDTLTASTNLGGTRVTFNSLEITRGRSRVSGKGWYDLSTRAFDGTLNGNDFDIADVAPLEQSRVKVAGIIDFSAQASGTLERPDVTARLHIHNVAFNGEAAGDYLIDAVTHGPDMHLSGHSQFDKAELSIDGNVRLRELWPAHIDFHFNHLDVDSFLESYLHGHITGHSAVAGDLVLQGPLRDPRNLTLIGNLTDLYADVEKVKIRNDGPLRFTLSEQMLTINSLHLIGENTDFSATGTIQLSGGQLNLHGNGRIGLQLVQSYDPDLSGSGSISGQVNVTGSTAAPIVHGTLQVENAAISDINLPSALSDLNGTLQFSQNQVTIEKLTGRTGGGSVSFTGHAQLNGKQLSFDLSADADSVRLRYPPGVSSTATATLRWNGTSSGSLLSGDITVNKLGVTPGFDFGAYLERSISSSSLPQTDPVLNNIRLDLHVVTAPDLQMQTSVLRLRGDADLRVRGNAAKPVLLGRADVFEGEAYFSGTKYRLERGGITFGTPAASNAAASVPFIDLEATTHVRDYDITLSVTGPADRPKLNYRSEPPLPTNDIIGLLAFGQTTEESALQQTSQSAFSQQASNAMLAAALNATLNNRTQRLFGNSRIKIDPQGLETETSPTQSGPAVTIEQQVKDNLTLTYTTNVAQTSQQVIRAEYYVSRNVSVVAIRDQNGVVSFDVKIRRRKR